MKSNQKIALLIDAENYRDPELLFNQFCEGIENYGSIVKRIAFGEWGYNPRLTIWSELCKEERIEMQGLNGFKGKNAADRSLIKVGTLLLQGGLVDTLAIYSRDMGFALAFAVWKSMEAKIIAPKMGNEFIPDADYYVKIERSPKMWIDKRRAEDGGIQATTELGAKLSSLFPDYLSSKD